MSSDVATEPAPGALAPAPASAPARRTRRRPPERVVAVAGTVLGLDRMGRLLLRDRASAAVHRVVAGHVFLR